MTQMSADDGKRDPPTHAIPYSRPFAVEVLQTTPCKATWRGSCNKIIATNLGSSFVIPAPGLLIRHAGEDRNPRGIKTDHI